MSSTCWNQLDFRSNQTPIVQTVMSSKPKAVTIDNSPLIRLNYVDAQALEYASKLARSDLKLQKYSSLPSNEATGSSKGRTNRLCQSAVKTKPKPPTPKPRTLPSRQRSATTANTMTRHDVNYRPPRHSATQALQLDHPARTMSPPVRDIDNWRPSPTKPAVHVERPSPIPASAIPIVHRERPCQISVPAAVPNPPTESLAIRELRDTVQNYAAQLDGIQRTIMDERIRRDRQKQLRTAQQSQALAETARKKWDKVTALTFEGPKSRRLPLGDNVRTRTAPRTTRYDDPTLTSLRRSVSSHTRGALANIEDGGGTTVGVLGDGPSHGGGLGGGSDSTREPQGAFVDTQLQDVLNIEAELRAHEIAESHLADSYGGPKKPLDVMRQSGSNELDESATEIDNLESHVAMMEREVDVIRNKWRSIQYVEGLGMDVTFPVDATLSVTEGQEQVASAVGLSVDRDQPPAIVFTKLARGLTSQPVYKEPRPPAPRRECWDDTLTASEEEGIRKYRRQYTEYLHRCGIRSDADPWRLVELVSEELLQEVIDGIVSDFDQQSTALVDTLMRGELAESEAD